MSGPGPLAPGAWRQGQACSILRHAWRRLVGLYQHTAKGMPLAPGAGQTCSVLRPPSQPAAPRGAAALPNSLVTLAGCINTPQRAPLPARLVQYLCAPSQRPLAGRPRCWCPRYRRGRHIYIYIHTYIYIYPAHRLPPISTGRGPPPPPPPTGNGGRRRGGPNPPMADTCGSGPLRKWAPQIYGCWVYIYIYIYVCMYACMHACILCRLT